MPKLGDRAKRTIIQCAFCGKDYEIRNCYLKRKQTHCCSRSCSVSYRNADPNDILGTQKRPGRNRIHPIKIKRDNKQFIIKHGHASGGKTSPTYQSWRAMHQRCECPNNKDYKRYGGRGITVTVMWNTFIQFLSDMGERPSKDYSLDRINPDGNYEASNCQWILKAENSRKSNVERSHIKGGYLQC